MGEHGQILIGRWRHFWLDEVRAHARPGSFKLVGLCISALGILNDCLASPTSDEMIFLSRVRLQEPPSPALLRPSRVQLFSL